MKTALLLGVMALAAAGCSTYQGGMGTDTETTYGTAAEMRSPSGLDRARGSGGWTQSPSADFPNQNPPPNQLELEQLPPE